MPELTKERVKEVCDEVDELDLPDGAHWAMVCERLGVDDLSEIVDYLFEDEDDA